MYTPSPTHPTLLSSCCPATRWVLEPVAGCPETERGGPWGGSVCCGATEVWRHQWGCGWQPPPRPRACPPCASPGWALLAWPCSFSLGPCSWSSGCSGHRRSAQAATRQQWPGAPGAARPTGPLGWGREGCWARVHVGPCWCGCQMWPQWGCAAPHRSSDTKGGQCPPNSEGPCRRKERLALFGNFRWGLRNLSPMIFPFPK